MSIYAKTVRGLILLLVTLSLAGAAGAADKIRVLLVSGGHGYDVEQFNQMFADNPDITVEKIQHPNAQAKFKPDAAKTYDVVVFYDMYQKITDESKQDFVNLLKQGKGVVAMHHCLANYQDWPEWSKIVGGKYLLVKKGETNALASTYKHDVDFTVKVEKTSHPIIAGLSDFQTHDETYGKCVVNADVQPLLTTDEPTSTKTVAWCKQYEASRIAYIMLGHDKVAYANPSFIKLVRQAIQWAAVKP